MTIRGVVPADRSGAVALMHVEIDHQDAAHGALVEQHPGRHRDVVEDAEPGTAIGERVVTAAGGVAGEASIEGEAGGEQCSGSGRPGPGHDLGRERQAQAADRIRLAAPADHGCYIGSSRAHGGAMPGLAEVGTRRAASGASPRATSWRSSAPNFGIGNRCPAGSGAT